LDAEGVEREGEREEDMLGTDRSEFVVVVEDSELNKNG